MRFVDAAARLRALPDPLPPAPEVLTPVLARDGAPRPSLGDESSARPASVLVLVFPDEAGESRVVLTERVSYDGHHSGEVSFPGGKPDPADADHVATALREAAEEVGLDGPAEGVEVVGLLERVWIAVSGYRITPVVALVGRRPSLTPDPAEVARIVEARLAEFLPGASIRVVERRVRDFDVRYGAYAVDDLEVWGATARILGQLGAVLGGDPSAAAVPTEGEPRRG